MSNIKVNEYVLKDPRFNKDRTVVNMSDIHSNVVALNNIVKLLEEIKASYIYVPGDTLDSIDNPHNKEIMELLKKVGNISQTFLSVGNHEMCELSYETGKKENLEQYKKLLENVKEKMDENKFNVLLLHSPNSLIQNGKIDRSSDVIRNMNLILCGHNHGGLMPTFAQDILKGHRGLAGPYAKLFQPNAYGVYNEEDTSVLVSNGVTKISATSEAGKINGILNKIYTPEIDVIHMVQSDEHSLKLENRSVRKF